MKPNKDLQKDINSLKRQITDFERENVITISELDSIKYSGTDYDVFLEDSLVNYSTSS